MSGSTPAPVVVGTTRGSDIYVAKDSRLAKGAQAILFWRNGQWNVLPSHGRVLVDGTRPSTRASRLVPGTHLTFGGTTLIAESPQYIELQAFLHLLLGWGMSQQQGAVERALVALREGQRAQLPVCLQGEGALVPIAAELHRRSFPPSSPFLVRRFEQLHLDVLRAAIEEVGHGTLCVEGANPLRPWSFSREAWRRIARPAVQVVLCQPASSAPRSFPATQTIGIPPLRSRGTEEIKHVVRACFLEATSALEPRSDGWLDAGTPGEVSWVLAHASATVAEVLMATRNIVASRVRAEPAAAGEGERASDPLLIN